MVILAVLDTRGDIQRMIQKIKTGIISVLMVGVVSVSFAAATSSIAEAAPSKKTSIDATCNAYFLTLPAWYNGLAGRTAGSCTVVSPTDLGGNKGTQISRFIWLIALNALQMLLQIVAYLAVGFIIYGGFMYLTSAGRSDKITRGREMIQNAVIGLVISLLAVALVAYVGGQIGV